jgi:hypothetical protein
MYMLELEGATDTATWVHNSRLKKNKIEGNFGLRKERPACIRDLGRTCTHVGVGGATCFFP